MREILIKPNEAGQRLDRFLNKYLPKANSSVLQKYIRTKKIKVNKKRATSDLIINDGDIINIYIYDEVLEKYEKDERKISKHIKNLEFMYDDENISIVYKPTGILTHPANKDDYGKTLVDDYVQYLIVNKEYIPRLNKTFTPAFVNRLDRNTSGMLIGAKNFSSVKLLNEAIKENNIIRKYRCIVIGNLEKEMTITRKMKKDEAKNIITGDNDGIEAKTIIKPIYSNKDYTLVEAELITGRTHQIRFHLSEIGHPIIGDPKYGNYEVNNKLKSEFNLKNQYLIAYKTGFVDLKEPLSYLKDKEFKLDEKYYYRKLEINLLGGIYEI